MTVYRIRFEGPAALAVRVATALADAEGVELRSSGQPSNVGEGSVALDLSAEGMRDAITAAVSDIDDGLPKDASIELVDE